VNVSAYLAATAFAVAAGSLAMPALAFCDNHVISDYQYRYFTAVADVSAMKRAALGGRIDPVKAGLVRATLRDIGAGVRGCIVSEKNDRRAFFLRIFSAYLREDEAYWQALGGNPVAGQQADEGAIRYTKGVKAEAASSGVPSSSLAVARRAIRHGYALLYEIFSLENPKAVVLSQRERSHRAAPDTGK